MKVKFIHPKDDSIDYLKNRRGFGYPLLTFPVLAGYTPAEVDEVEIIDEEYEEIDFDAPVDLVGITAMTYLAPRAYEIADTYRQRGVKFVDDNIMDLETFLPGRSINFIPKSIWI